jgi:hypothetical protein
LQISIFYSDINEQYILPRLLFANHLNTRRPASPTASACPVLPCDKYVDPPPNCSAFDNPEATRSGPASPNRQPSIGQLIDKNRQKMKKPSWHTPCLSGDNPKAPLVTFGHQ